MTKKTVGYVGMEWTCPTCGNRNPGLTKKCTTCGTAQPENVQFEQATQDVLITDQAVIAQAQAGPDVHCPYCGTRNTAGAPKCKQCGGDLTGAKARESGRVVGGMRKEPAPPVKCPACATENPATALKCANCGAALAKPPAAAPAAARPAPKMNPMILIAVGAIALVLCVVLFVVLGSGRGKTEQVAGTVSDVQWRRVIALQALMPITLQDWRDNIASDAQIGRCEDRLYQTVDEPAPDSVEVCGTPYVLDTGTGVGEVQQDCQYEVYREYCQYTSLGWQAIAPIVLAGSDFNPQWPAERLGEEQRESGRSEEYVVTFQTENGPAQLTVSSLEQFQRFAEGSEWMLEVDGRGRVVGVEAAQ
jgi:DNA-directed RNA polymerase subunit RPC12/RpoP